MASPHSGQVELSSEILQALSKNDPILSTEAFPTQKSADVKSALDRLGSRSMVIYETIDREEAILEAEAEQIEANGSHEARVFEALRETMDGLTLAELESVVGDKNVVKVGYGKAFKSKWIAKGKDGRFVASTDSIEDMTRDQLRIIKLSRTYPDPKVITDLKKRKLVKMQKVISYKIKKGPKFALEIAKEETDLTPEMLASGSWKTSTFKPYNFKSLGADQNAGALHPLNKVRHEFRQIFFEMGFEEMPTNKYVETGFWNFDALFVPQQHPARDLQDTFYISDPKTADKPRATSDSDKADYEAYLQNVKEVHQDGKYGSIGYRYPWAEDEALRLVLRTHTTAISTAMLHKLASRKGLDGRPPPARYFSIDRVFRNETVDATHLAEFHQVEGVIADYGLSLGGLMEFMEIFFNKMGIEDLRFKPAYNPYTEPSMEIFSFHKGLNKLVEIGNSGMFRPEMLESMGLPKDMRVFGWGLSLERPTMIKYKVNNIRELLGHKVDLSFIERNPAVVKLTEFLTSPLICLSSHSRSLQALALNGSLYLQSKSAPYAMALTSRFAGRSSFLLRQRRVPACPAKILTTRNFTTRTPSSSVLTKSPEVAGKGARYVRLFSRCVDRANQTQPAPSAKAYLESGVVKTAANPVDVKKVLVIGSGGLSIGQAGEFDYSGSQALKALKEAGVASVLINPNIATIQTAHVLTDEVYYLPVTPEYVTYVIERERPDGIFLTFGGQTALNLGVQMERMGIFERYGVKVLGTSIKTLETSEDRDLFAKALGEIDIPIAKSIAVGTVEEALDAAKTIGYPIIVRAAYALGGLGSGFAQNEEELRNMSARSLTLSPQILVEKSLKGWKEVEYEVVRDASNNCITVCNMENFDPLGIHTGDSIVVAPSQTLSDEEYHMLRSAAIKIVRHLGVVGECNVQYALQPDGLDYRVIEVNARLSRSSALASKATGYPLAYTAAKIGLGHTLPELPNAVTKTTTANFEPSLDYVVTKIPRWDLAKFQHVKRDIGSAMKSVGEVMAIGRTFEESIQKAIRQVDPRFHGFQGDKFDDLDYELQNPTDRRWLAVGQAMLHENYTVDRVHELTKIDRWFLYKLQNIVDCTRELEDIGSLFGIKEELMMKAKKMGFSDRQIAKAVGCTEDEIRARRKNFGITPFVKKIDTLAAEFPADTNYLYTTYNATSHDVTFDDHGIIILGSGVYRIGSSVEFDWCAVSATLALKEMGKKTVMINYNPETYSTDFDTADKLYFEELSYERVMDIYELETATGVVVSVGGQLPQNIALRLQETGGARILGTDPKDIDKAEDRQKFSEILDSIGVDQPAWKELTSVADAQAFADEVSYPVLVRPSYVLSGAAMTVIRSKDELKEKLEAASNVSPDHPVVITKFIEGAQEIDVDAVGSNGKLIVHAISEHVEQAGVHSGDATLVLPPASLDHTTMDRVKEIAVKVAKAWSITGPFNMQIIKADNPEGGLPALKVIECNLRASRSFPFVSKVLGLNFIDVATKALVGQNVPEPTDLMAVKRDYLATKVPQFSWTRLAGADPFLGVEMASTGEIACFGKDLVEAYWASLQSTMNFRVPEPGEGLLFGGDISKDSLTTIVDYLSPLGYKLFAAEKEVKTFLESSAKNNVSVEIIEFPTEDKRALREVFKKYDIRGVFNLAHARGKTVLDVDYVMRRNAVDFGVPLFMEPKTAELFAQCMNAKLPRKEGIPGEVRRWSDFIGGKPL
ncbi:hypothetical protein B7494_g5139 [Chlorociboria aeruginascens]|nr:hypothetical protein B7494_g5139 [Chlorociboria aeruginascens]